MNKRERERERERERKRERERERWTTVEVGRTSFLNTTGEGRVYEANEVKNKRQKLRCLLLRRKKKNIFYLFTK
jgi:hypothetical protein